MHKRLKKQLILIISIIAAILIAAVGLIFYFTHRNTIPKIPFSEIKSDSKIPDKGYSNLDFSEAVLNIPDVDKFYKLYVPDEETLSPEECASNCYELFDTIFDYIKPGDSGITFSDNAGNPLPDGEAGKSYNIVNQFYESSINYFTDDENVYHCEFDVSGRFLIYDSQVIQIAAVGAGASGIAEEIVHLDRGEKAPDTKHLVNSEEYSPAQALEFAENLLSQKISKLLPCDQVSPTELIIIKDPESDNYLYKFQFEYVYEGAPYLHLALPRSIEGAQAQYGVIYITIAAPDRVGEIYNMMYYPGVKNDGEYKDKYIPLYAAADLVSEYLAPYFKQTISEVTIKYAVDSNDEKQYFKPYWCFIIDIDDPLSRDYCMSANAILVDMQTGEIITCVDTNDGELVLSNQ